MKYPFKRRPKKLDIADYTVRWQLLQKNCASRKTWHVAVTEADDLLAKALKQRRYKGKTMGERLVAAQHDIKANDTVWFSHKFSKRVHEIDVRKLKKKDVADALNGFRQALRDLGALEQPHD